MSSPSPLSIFCLTKMKSVFDLLCFCCRLRRSYYIDGCLGRAEGGISPPGLVIDYAFL